MEVFRNKLWATPRTRVAIFSTFIIIPLLSAASSAAGEANEPKNYNYGAVCDFALARLYEVTQEISDNDSDHVNALRSSGKLAMYKNTDIEAQYNVQGNKISISTAHFGKNRIFPADRNAHDLLGRLGINYVAENSKETKVQCDMINLTIIESNGLVESVNIEQIQD